MSRTTLTRANITNKIYHYFKLDENDEDMVKLAARSFAAAIETTKKSSTGASHPESAYIAKADSDVLHHHLDSLFTRAKAGSASRKALRVSVKHTPYVAVFACMIDLQKLKIQDTAAAAAAAAQDSGSATAPCFDCSASTQEKAKGEGRCSADWPAELSDRWQFYCRCGRCNVPFHRFSFAVATVVDGGDVTLPIKIFAIPHEHGSSKDMLLKITLVSDHHNAVYNGVYVTAYDRTHDLRIIPQQIELYQPPDRVKKLFDERDEWGNIEYPGGGNFQCGWGEQPTVHQWERWQYEEQPMMDATVARLSWQWEGTPVAKKTEVGGDGESACVVM